MRNQSSKVRMFVGEGGGAEQQSCHQAVFFIRGGGKSTGNGI